MNKKKLTILSIGILFLVATFLSPAKAQTPIEPDCTKLPGNKNVAYFTFSDTEGRKRSEFTVQSCDPQFIAKARRIIYGYYDEGDTHIQGAVYKGSKEYNQKWSFYLMPQSLRYFENAIELCDGSPQYIEDNLDAWIAQSRLWCPWASTLVREENLNCSARKYSMRECKALRKLPGYPEQYPCEAKECEE